MKASKKSFRIRLTTITPVHVGTGETVDFTRVVIEPEQRLIYIFNPLELVSRVEESEREELTKIIDQPGVSALVRLQKFYLYRVFPKIEQIALAKYRIPTDLVEDYKRCLGLTRESEIIREFNSLNIHLCYTETLTYRPCIPGSSLKGALRTGFLEGLYREGINKGKEVLKSLTKAILAIKDEGKYRKEKDRLFKQLEDSLLERGRIQDDPFGGLRLSDLRAYDNVKLEVLYGINVRKENLSEGGLRVLLEAISPGARFEGTLEITENGKGLTWEALYQYNYEHYRKVLNEEVRLLNSFKISTLRRLNQSLEALRRRRRVLFLKIGKFSGSPAVTIEGLRRILSRRSRGEVQIVDSPTTIWLASRNKKINEEVEPFGWVILEVLDGDQESR